MTIYAAGDAVVELAPRIVVFGVGGAGGNAVDNMIEAELGGVDFVVANTDSQALSRSQAKTRVQLGAEITGGMGAGGRPEVGAEAAEVSAESIRGILKGAHMVFIAAGMGGGTGTGAAPVVAQLARELGVLTVAVVTRPLVCEGAQRARTASEGLEALESCVDTLIVIPNQNLFRVVDETTSLRDSFSMADAVLHAGVRGITDLMTRNGLINLDFADVRTVMSEAGQAMMGTGEATGERRAAEAALAAVTNPLLDDVSLSGARAVLVNITGGADVTLYELDEVANEIRNEADPDARIIVGSALDESLDGRLRVSVLATGIDGSAAEAARSAVDALPAQTQRPRRVKTPEPVVAADALDGLKSRGEQPGAGPVAGSGPSLPPDAPFEPMPDREGEAAFSMRPQVRKPKGLNALTWFSRRRGASVPHPSGAEAAPHGPVRPHPLNGHAPAAAALSGERDEADLDIPAFLRR